MQHNCKGLFLGFLELGFKHSSPPAALCDYPISLLFRLFCVLELGSFVWYSPYKPFPWLVQTLVTYPELNTVYLAFYAGALIDFFLCSFFCLLLSLTWRILTWNIKQSISICTSLHLPFVTWRSLAISCHISIVDEFSIWCSWVWTVYAFIYSGKI